MKEKKKKADNLFRLLPTFRSGTPTNFCKKEKKRIGKISGSH